MFHIVNRNIMEITLQNPTVTSISLKELMKFRHRYLPKYPVTHNITKITTTNIIVSNNFFLFNAFSLQVARGFMEIVLLPGY